MIKSTITALSLVALLTLTTAASAQQQGTLGLDLIPSAGISGVWASVSSGDAATMTVTQLPAGKARPASIYIFISGVQVMGDLDLKSTVLLAQGKTDGDFALKLQIPKMGEALFSVQALAVYQDGSYAISPVLTVVVNGGFTDPTEPTQDEDIDEVADVAAPKTN